MTKEEIIENYGDVCPDILFADGFDEAIIGTCFKTHRVIYSYQKCIDELCKDMEVFDAMEYMDFNVLGSHVGDMTPIWLMDCSV